MAGSEEEDIFTTWKSMINLEMVELRIEKKKKKRMTKN